MKDRKVVFSYHKRRDILSIMSRSGRSFRPSPAHLLAGALIGAGVTHAVLPSFFDAMIPPWIPGSPRFWTYASGVAEVAVGAAVARPDSRRLGGYAAAALFVGVFPANVQMAWDWRREAWPYRAVALGRLPMQVPMITHALRVAREGPA
jgi:uncharacterized membrane protein